MLFTRCPSCQTTFRITADTLRIASGAVRCGSCATVFSAYSGLRQEALAEGMRPDDEFLSPTLQTRELAGVEDIPSPDVDDSGDALADDDGGIIVVEEPAEEDPPPRAAGAIHVAPPEPALLELPPDEPAEAPAPADGADDTLQFDAPDDGWAQLLSEIEESIESPDETADEAPLEEILAAEADTLDAAAELPDEREPGDFWDIGEPVGLGAVRPGGLDAADPDPAHSLRLLDEPSARAETTPDATDATDDEVGPEEIHATLSAVPDPDIVAALEAGLAHRPMRARPTRPWQLGSALLLVVLAAQLVHYFRAPLAIRPTIGPLLQRAYGVLGVELNPGWDLEQYEITNWAATAGTSESGVGDLRITAQIRNGGPRAQPYPSIQLELKDRWEAVIGSRIFRPREYLVADIDPSGLMAAGDVVPASLAVVDPGLDASGFELDVCLEIESARMRCAADRVFD